MIIKIINIIKTQIQLNQPDTPEFVKAAAPAPTGILFIVETDEELKLDEDEDEDDCWTEIEEELKEELEDSSFEVNIVEDTKDAKDAEDAEDVEDVDEEEAIP